MPTIKLTTWNIEHFSKLIPTPSNKNRPRLEGIVKEITEIDPDILCMIEGPGNFKDLIDWVNSPQGLGGRFRVATIPGTDEILRQNPANPRKALQDLYAMKGNDQTGNQWIWFLVRDGLFQESDARILNPEIWQDLTKQPQWSIHEWGKFDATTHSHWRHPQTLILKLGSVEVEIIGVHLKSKINMEKAFNSNNELMDSYVVEALRSRIRLATEAYNIRLYIERRFEQIPDPRIFVCGDMNDGPGKGHFEREFLFFDLVSNIQGDVFIASRFLNHALFDFADHLRWTTNFRDEVEEWSRQQNGTAHLPAEPIDPIHFQLLDHILFTQALVGESASPRVRSRAGLVEHTIHQRINALLSKSNKTSDHVPVSVHVTL